VAELANIGATSIVRVADVDQDRKNELIAGGNSGKITVYKQPIPWQSGDYDPVMPVSHRVFQ